MTSSSALILDLDDTLVDTACLANLRQAKRWKDCNSRIAETSIFAGVKEAVAAVTEAGISVGIVTTSVSYYAQAVLKFHGIKYDSLICYHDCPRRKPHPDPVLLCLTRMRADAASSLGVGDADIDAAAYAAAGVTSWGAGWSGALSRQAPWNRIIDTPGEIVAFWPR